MINFWKNKGGTDMDLIWRRGTVEELELLTRTRGIVLRAANGLPESQDMTAQETAARAYYSRALADGTHVAYLVLDGETVAGAGGVSFFSVMPTYHKPRGLRAYIMNMYTHPAYRRRGIARRTLELLVAEARRRKVDRIDLEATDMGRPLYESFGFREIPGEMCLTEE